MSRVNLVQVYEKLAEHFGKQHWRRAETEFEIMIGAILIQRANWRSVRRAIANLKDKELLVPRSLAMAPLSQVEELIHHVGLFRQKAKRLIKLSQHLTKNYEGSLEDFFDRPTEEIREELLSLEGVGQETANIILLFAADKLTFPISAYTVRVCKRLGIRDLEPDQLRGFFERSLPKDLETYKEFHALTIRLGSAYCKAKARCSLCPLADECHFALTMRRSQKG